MIGRLVLTDGITQIDLLKAPYFLQDWTPNTAEIKNGGEWQENAMVESRRLYMHNRQNIIDSFTFTLSGSDTDTLIRATQDIRRLLEKARYYWEADWQNSPVWLEAQGERETNIRYALVYDFRLPADSDPYHAPFNNLGLKAIEAWTLVLEHGLWQAQAPMSADCVYLRNHNRYPWVMWISPDVDFAGGGSTLKSADPIFDDLPSNPFTAEIWLYGDLNFDAGAGYIFWKNQWYLKVNANRTLTAFATFGGGNASLTTVTALPINPQDFTHIAVTCNANTFKIWINGLDGGGIPVAGIAPYTVDNATDLHVGSTNVGGTNLFINRTTIGSRMTWMRISDNVRYAFAFTPPVYNNLPIFDANTIVIENGGQTFAGENGFGSANIPWTNPFAPFFTNDILGTNPTLPEVGLLGVEAYLENKSGFYCDFDTAFSINGDREGCGLDFAFYYDASAGTYGPNIIGNTPSLMWPTLVADANDYFYWGSSLTQGAAVPLAIVMEFLVAGVFQISDVEYWTGAAWTAFPNWEANDTNADKVVYISVMPIGSITARTLNGYHGYIFRIARWPTQFQPTITSLSLISNPAIEIAGENISSSVFGDLPAIARLSQHAPLPQTNSGGVGYTEFPRKTFLALHSTDRDINEPNRLNWFTPYINFSKEATLAAKPRNQAGIFTSIATRAAGTYANIYDYYSPQTWCMQLSIGAASTEFVTMAISEYAMLSFQGKFRVFARMVAQSGSKGNVTVIPYLTYPYYLQLSQAQQIPLGTELIEFGIIDLPAIGNGRRSEYNLTFVFTCSVAGPILVNLHDLILWPIDEWNAETEVVTPPTTLTTYVPGLTGTDPGSGGNNFALEDPIISPKWTHSAVWGTLPASATVPLDRDDLLYQQGLAISMSYNFPFLQANKAQKLYCLQAFRYTVTTPTNIVYRWPFYMPCGWTVEKQERYESMRGDR